MWYLFDIHLYCVQVSPLSLSVVATDNDGQSSQQALVVTVSVAVLTAGVPFVLDTVDMLSGSALVNVEFSLAALPEGSGLTINPATARLEGTPSAADAARSQPMPVVVEVTDTAEQKVVTRTTLYFTIDPAAAATAGDASTQQSSPQAKANLSPITAVAGDTVALDVSSAFVVEEGVAGRTMAYSLNGLPEFRCVWLLVGLRMLCLPTSCLACFITAAWRSTATRG